MDAEIFDSRLLFIGLDNFYNNREFIKLVFHTKSIREQYLYKLYVYSRPFITDHWKDLIWDYLQSDISYEELSYAYNMHKNKTLTSR